MQRRVQEIGIASFARPADAATKLVQLGQAHMVGILDDQRIGIRNIQSRFNDRRANQHVILAVPEPFDGVLQLILIHLAMRHDHARFRNKFTNMLRGLLDRPHTVVHVEHLAISQQFTTNSRRDLLILLHTYVGQHGVTIFRRGKDRRHIANSRHRHLQRARNRRRRHRQHVDVGTQRLDVLLVLHTETLFLVDNNEAQVLPLHPCLQQTVSTDHDVDLPLGKPGQDFAGLLRRGEAGQLADRNGETFHPLAEGGEMLLCQQRRGDKEDYLFPLLHSLECGTDGDLGFTVSHVAHNHAVHGDGLLHILFDRFDGVVLVFRFREREVILHLPLPRGVRRERVPRRGLTLGIELHEVSGYIANRGAGLLLGVLPIGSTHFR